MLAFRPHSLLSIVSDPSARSVPVIVDPNASDFVLWESGAIVEYLVSKYDTSNKLCSAASSPEFYLEKQFLHFQMSGQGPYFGQAYWFTKLHAEKLPSAIERYQKEIARVVHVLDMSLQGKEYLVGGKVSYADLSFVPWFWIAEKIHPEWASVVAENKSFVGWLERLEARPAVKKMKEQRAEKMEG